MHSIQTDAFFQEFLKSKIKLNEIITPKNAETNNPSNVSRIIEISFAIIPVSISYAYRIKIMAIALFYIPSMNRIE